VRGRPTLYSAQLGRRITARLTAGVPLSTICAGEGIDRSSVYRWRAEHPEDFCNIGDDTPAEHRAPSEPESEFCNTAPSGVFPADEKGDPCGRLFDPEPEDPVYGDVVMVVSARRKPAPATPTPPAPPARRDPNAQRPPPHWLRNDADDIWRQHVGIDGVIGGGTGSW